MSHETLSVDALIVGSGPTGLTLGLALLKQDKSVLIVEKHLKSLPFSRAILINPDSLAFLEPFGVSQQLREIAFPVNGISLYDRGQCISRMTLNTVPLSNTHPLCLPQIQTESCLESAYLAAGGLLKRGYLFEPFDGTHQSPKPFTFTIQPNTPENDCALEVTATWLFGCDGFHSTVRQSLHIPYPGDSLPNKPRSLDVRLSHWPFETNVNLFIEPDGVVFAVQMGQELVRLVTTSDAALDRIKSQWPIEAILWDTTFEVHFHVAQQYGCGHIWLAGDAVHVHSPIGGRGMNMGIADAIALASAVEHGDLTTYQSRREHEAVQWVAINKTLSRLTLSNRGIWPLARQLLLRLLPLFARLFGNHIAQKAFLRLTGISESQLN